MFNGPYYYVYGDEFADSSLFGKLKPLVEDFARRSKFRAFYKSNAAYYAQEVKRQRELLPVTKMWSWLEGQFPRINYQSYRVVSSPLIKGSHSTQNYTGARNNAAWRESVMFICGAARYDRNRALSEKQKEGLFSGVLFTEIDHNYVNRVTSRYRKQVDSIFSARGLWARSGNSSDYYGSPESVFNEYMTHAAFCLYIADTYDKATAGYVITNREELMEGRRNFIRSFLIPLKRAAFRVKRAIYGRSKKAARSSIISSIAGSQ
ncbi:MAG: DUF4932 domain-containing protein [Sphingobacteriales bacterium]|nr:MAG: DUF4932 domain-containing protein [Sphingobacteriales bacterium]